MTQLTDRPDQGATSTDVLAPAGTPVDAGGAGVHDRTWYVAAVTDALGDILDVPLEGVTESTSLFNELGLDSTGVLDLLMSLEESLAVEVDTESLELRHFSTVGTLAEYLQSALAG